MEIKEKIKKIKIPDPEESISKFNKWFDKDKKILFLFTILAGIITHITMLTETIMSQDGLWNSMQYFKTSDWEISLGRWGIILCEKLVGFLAVPTITTVLSLILMSFASVLVVDIFKFKSKILNYITCLAIIVSPSLTITFLYVYTSFAYCINFLLSVFIVWLVFNGKSRKGKYILGSLLFMCSLAIYQSYVGVIVGLSLLVYIIKLFENDYKIKDCFIDILKEALMFLIGGIIYLIVSTIILNIFGLEFSSYKNSDSLGLLNSILSLKDTIFSTYKDFLAFFFRDRIIYNTNYKREKLYLLFFIVSVIFGIIKLFQMVKNSDNKKYGLLKSLIIFVFIALIPLGFNIINVLLAASEIYVLTAIQMTLIIPFCLYLMESTKKLNLVKWIEIISCLIIIFTYYLADNVSYQALKMTYNQAYSVTERIVDRMEQVKGYNKYYPVVMGGIVGNNNYGRSSNLYDYTLGSVVNNTVFHGTYYGQIGTWKTFFKVFFGMDVVFAEEHVYKEIVNSEFYDEMDVFPGENSVKLYNGVIVVKLDEDPPQPF